MIYVKKRGEKMSIWRKKDKKKKNREEGEEEGKSQRLKGKDHKKVNVMKIRREDK